MKHFFSNKAVPIIGAVVVGAFIVGLAAGANASYKQADPLYSAREAYSKATSNEELSNLINSYYDAYSKNEFKALKKLASPISAMEKSYIKFLSEHIDSYDVVEIFSKPGATPDSYLVSVNVNVNFKDVKNPSPGLDFFYVVRDDEGELKIDNRYSAFNQLYEEEETDPDIQALYDEFEIQEDVNLLRIRIQNEYNSLIESDSQFGTFINETLPAAATNWAADYQAALEAKAAEEEAARIAAEEEQKRLEEEQKRLEEEEAARAEQEEAERARAEELSKAVQMITISKVNIRRAPNENEDNEPIGYAEPDTVVVKYGDEGDWSIIDYYNEKAYIKSEYLIPYVETATEENAE